MKEQCPRGTIYAFEFDLPGLKWKECFLKSISEGDKQLIHKYVLRIAGGFFYFGIHFILILVKKNLVKSACTSNNKSLIKEELMNNLVKNVSTANNKSIIKEEVKNNLVKSISTANNKNISAKPLVPTSLQATSFSPIFSQPFSPPRKQHLHLSPPKLLKRSRVTLNKTEVNMIF
jgi:hypothetical protein